MRRLISLVAALLSACGPTEMTTTTTTTTTTTVTCAGTDTWAGYGQRFFATNCRTCHEHVDSFSAQDEVQAGAAGITAQITTGAMPQGAVLSGEEKARVLAWLKCGAP